MNRLIAYSVLSFVGWMVSCGDFTERKYCPELLHLESFVSVCPDSVYRQLDSLETEGFSPADWALYWLVRTEAADKLYKTHTTDSLIINARKYFSEVQDIPRLTKAWYLSGRIHTDWEKWEMATKDFLKAKELAEDSNDFALKGRIVNYLGRVNWENYQYSKAQSYYREAYCYYKQARDTLSMSYVLKEIGETYMSAYKTDSAIFMYKQALALAESANNRNVKASIYNRLGYMYRKTGMNEQALAYLRLGLKYSDVKPYAIYNNIGSLYLQMNRLDSARFYLEQALEASSLPTLCMANYHLGELSNKEKKMDEAYVYYKKYELLADSLDHSLQINEVISLQQNQKEKNLIESHKTKLNLRNLIIASLIILITFLCILFYRLRNKKQYYQKRTRKLIETIRTNEVFISHLREQCDKYSKDATSTDMKLKEQIERENLLLLKKFNDLNIEQCRRHSFLKKLYGSKKEILTVFETKDWKQYEDAFFSIYPRFTICLTKAFPKLSEQEVRICQLSIMGVKTSKIADVLLLQADTVSSYKQKIKKSCFPAENRTLEELLLPFIVG